MAGSQKRQIFRQAALDRLSSPEQLDRLVPVTDPFGWLALGAMTALLGAIVLWGIFGKIPEQVEGKGILVHTGGRVLDAMSPSEGTLARLLVKQNDLVEKGDKIAFIEQTTLNQEFRSAQETLAERQAEKREIEARFAKEFALKQKNFAQQTAAQRQIIAAARERTAYLKDNLEKRDALAKKGILPRDKVEEIRSDYNKVLQDISAAQNRILELQAESLDLKSAHQKNLTEINQRISNAEREIRELNSRLVLNGNVTAPASGRVSEVKVFEGEVVKSGASLVSIASSGSDVQVVLYIPTKDGKRVAPGMTVRVAPSVVKKEEHGTIIGTVADISGFPATQQGMLSVLQNERLVTEYSADGAPYAARINLIADKTTPSGFKWTSGTGPDIGISTGTTVEAEITVAEQAPINLIIPFIRKHTGIGFWDQWVNE